jgi:hypothetical protein
MLILLFTRKKLVIYILDLSFGALDIASILIYCFFCKKYFVILKYKVGLGLR